MEDCAENVGRYFAALTSEAVLSITLRWRRCSVARFKKGKERDGDKLFPIIIIIIIIINSNKPASERYQNRRHIRILLALEPITPHSVTEHNCDDGNVLHGVLRTVIYEPKVPVSCLISEPNPAAFSSVRPEG